MQDFLDSISFAFKETLNFKTMKMPLIFGIIVTIFWIFIGYIFWTPLVSLSGYFLDLVPFSMIRSNGALMLSAFLWFQLVLVTFALIFAFFGNIIFNFIEKKKYTSFYIFIALGSALFWTIIWFYQGDFLHAQFIKLLNWLPFKTIKGTIAYMISFYLIYSAIIVSMMFITSVYSKTFLTSIKNKYYPYDEPLEKHEMKTVFFTIKDTLVFTGISLVAIPLLFIPVLNIIIQIALWVWLIKDTFVFDSATLLFKDVSKEKLKKYKMSFYAISVLTAIFNFVPVFNIFGPFFGELSMFYYLKNKQIEGV